MDLKRFYGCSHVEKNDGHKRLQKGGAHVEDLSTCGAVTEPMALWKSSNIFEAMAYNTKL